MEDKAGKQRLESEATADFRPQRHVCRKKAHGSFLRTMCFCFTGKMPEKRSYYERLAAENKMIAVDSVTKELSLLVAADPYASGGKLDKARKFNVKIISLDEFLASVGSGGVEDEPDLFSAVQEEKTPEKADPFANGELFSFEE